MCDEQEIIKCAGCGVPVLTWWAPNGGGLLRGEYILIADTIWHPICWEKQIEPLFGPAHTLTAGDCGVDAAPTA